MMLLLNIFRGKQCILTFVCINLDFCLSYYLTSATHLPSLVVVGFIAVCHSRGFVRMSLDLGKQFQFQAAWNNLYGRASQACAWRLPYEVKAAILIFYRAAHKCQYFYIFFLSWSVSLKRNLLGSCSGCIKLVANFSKPGWACS